MSGVESGAPALNELLEKLVAARQLSTSDARSLARPGSVAVRSEEDVLRWLAKEYGLAFTALDDVEPDKEVLSLFPARILLRGLLSVRPTGDCGFKNPDRHGATLELRETGCHSQWHNDLC